MSGSPKAAGLASSNQIGKIADRLPSQWLLNATCEVIMSTLSASIIERLADEALMMCRADAVAWRCFSCKDKEGHLVVQIKISGSRHIEFSQTRPPRSCSKSALITSCQKDHSPMLAGAGARVQASGLSYSLARGEGPLNFAGFS